MVHFLCVPPLLIHKNVQVFERGCATSKDVTPVIEIVQNRSKHCWKAYEIVSKTKENSFQKYTYESRKLTWKYSFSTISWAYYVTLRNIITLTFKDSEQQPIAAKYMSVLYN